MKREDKRRVVTCGFYGKEKRPGEVVPAGMVYGPLLEIQELHMEMMEEIACWLRER
ncbi:MAG: hypothetical protein ACP5QG_04370 [candidate division WOR-3 bacterium]